MEKGDKRHLVKNEFAPVSYHHTILEDVREILNRMVEYAHAQDTSRRRVH